MKSTLDTNVSVIVVGAGPVGLMLAGELRLGGTDVLVVERLPQPTTESRGLGFTARATEVFEQRGLLERFADPQQHPRGHFGGIPMDYSVLPGGHFGVRNVEQSETEAVLGEWATELGAKFLRGHEVLAATDRGDFVEVQMGNADGATRTLRCRYLVGADGGRSTVRREAGFEFIGAEATCEMFLADVRGCELRSRFIGEKVRGGMVMAAQLREDVDRIIVCEQGSPPRSRTGPPQFSEVAGAWQRLTGEDISRGEPLWVSSFTDAARQVTEYRKGRVLLAGDAAHIHLPAGGQGLSVGVQDAVNLGWKLAAVASRSAPSELLDTYHDERHPVGRRVLLNTQAQGLLYLSGSEVDPLRAVMSELIELDEVGRLLAGMVSGLDVRYDVGPGDHPLLGARMPRCEVWTDEGATSTMRLLNAGRGVLLDVGDGPNVRAIAAGWADRVDLVAGSAEDEVLNDARAVLLRPDGHVAWTATDGGDLTHALHRWFGPPAPKSTTPQRDTVPAVG